MPERRPYTLLARYYDEFFSSHIPQFQRARRKLLREILPEVRSACDLACGTGTTAIELALRGIKVFAVDLSPTMCRLVRLKARSAGGAYRGYPGRHANTSFTGTSRPGYLRVRCRKPLPQKSDLGRTARAVARALRPGGYFYFDVNNRRHLEKNWPGAHWSERSSVVMVMRGRYDQRRAKGRVDLEWFIREGTRWRWFREQVEEVWWTASDIRQTLHGAGFERVQSWDARRFSGQHQLATGCRTFFLAQLANRR